MDFEIFYRFDNKYSGSLLERLLQRYPLVKNIVHPLFTSSTDSNISYLRGLTGASFAKVKNFAEQRKNVVEQKIVAKYESDVEKLVEQYESAAAKMWTGEELAKKFKKILEGFLLNMGPNTDYHEILRQYLENSKIRLEYFEKGRKLSDDQYIKLNKEEITLYAEYTENPEKKDEIIEMVRPVIYIDYEDEDGNVDTMYIEGACRIFTNAKL